MRPRRHGFCPDRRGSVLIESAIIFPVMVVMLLGTYEVAELVRANGQVGNAATELADLVAQQTNGVTGGTAGVLGSFCSAGKLVMTPYAASGTSGQAGAFSVAVASVTNTSGKAAVDWESDKSCTVAATALGTSAVTLATSPTNLVPNAGDSIIVVKVTYVYDGLVHMVVPGKYTMSQVAFARPRGLSTISCTSSCS